MRTTIRLFAATALVATAIACSPAPPPPPPGPTPAEMVAAADALDQQFLAAFNAGDVDGMLATYWNSPNLVSFSPDGGGQGYDLARTNLTQMVQGMPGAKIEFLTKRNEVHGDVVIGSGTWRLTMGPVDSPQTFEGRYTDVKMMHDGKWVYVMDHASVPLPPPAAPAAAGSGS